MRNNFEEACRLIGLQAIAFKKDELDAIFYIKATWNVVPPALTNPSVKAAYATYLEDLAEVELDGELHIDASTVAGPIVSMVYVDF